MLDSTTEAQRREISGPQRGSVEPDQTPRFCCWCLEELHNVACPRDSVRHPAPCPVYCVSLRLGNCHVITRSCSKAVYTEGGRETFFHWRHHTQHPFLLLCLAITKSCSCDHMRSPPPHHSQASIWSSYTGVQEPSPSLYLGTSPFFGLWGILLPICTSEVFSRTCRNFTQLEWYVSITALSMSPLTLNSNSLPLWPPVAATGETRLMRDTSSAIEGTCELRSDSSDLFTLKWPQTPPGSRSSA